MSQLHLQLHPKRKNGARKSILRVFGVRLKVAVCGRTCRNGKEHRNTHVVADEIQATMGILASLPKTRTLPVP